MMTMEAFAAYGRSVVTFTEASPCTAYAECQSGDGETIEADASWNMVNVRIGEQSVALSIRDTAMLGVWLLCQSVRLNREARAYP